MSAAGVRKRGRLGALLLLVSGGFVFACSPEPPRASAVATLIVECPDHRQFYVDGDAFDCPESEASLELPPGEHRVELRDEGGEAVAVQETVILTGSRHRIDWEVRR